MSTIREHAEQYLAMRRALGFKLTTFGTRLLGFVAYLEAHDMAVITTDAALAWAMTTPRSNDQVHWSRRIMVARIFARHMAVLDPATEIPPVDVLPQHYRRVTPHLFTARRSPRCWTRPTRCVQRCGPGPGTPSSACSR